MLQTGPPSNKEQEMKQAIEEIGGSVVNTILKNVPSIVDNSLKYILNILKEIPFIARIMNNMQGSDMNKILMIIGVLFVISFIMPFWILILLNMILTFILVFKAQKKCIS